MYRSFKRALTQNSMTFAICSIVYIIGVLFQYYQCSTAVQPQRLESAVVFQRHASGEFYCGHLLLRTCAACDNGACREKAIGTMSRCGSISAQAVGRTLDALPSITT